MEIDEACSPDREKKEREEAEKNLDDFTIEKRKMAEFIREIKTDIQERDEFYSKDQRSKAVTKGSEIRGKIKQAKEVGTALEKMYKDKHKHLKAKEKLPGFKPTEEKKAKDDNRKQVVELMWKHISELERQEKTVKGSSALDNLGEASESSGERQVVVAGIPDIDDPQFELLRKQDAEIDLKLDQTLQGVQRLKQLAVEAGAELDLQDKMIENLQTIANETLGELENVNGELKKTLKQVRSARNCCCDICLCLLCLGVCAAIYFVITKHT